MIIIGAGMAGLIAANYFRKQNPVIIEKQSHLPDNHAALLRFRSDKVFKVAGLQSRIVTVRKCIVFGADFMSGPNPYLANMYSAKVTGKVEDRSIWNMETEKRHIAPDGFLNSLANGCNISFNTESGNGSYARNTMENKITVSTIPMPLLMNQLGWPDIPTFQFVPIWTVSADIPGVNINQTIYFPDKDVPYYRASFVGSRFIVEFIRDPVDEIETLANEVIDYFGMPSTTEKLTYKKQGLGKMLPIDDEIRKDFMHWATEKYNIYSLGRFATWRPILLDDVVDDLAVIERMMKSKYSNSLLR